MSPLETRMGTRFEGESETKIRRRFTTPLYKKEKPINKVKNLSPIPYYYIKEKNFFLYNIRTYKHCLAETNRRQMAVSATVSVNRTYFFLITEYLPPQRRCGIYGTLMNGVIYGGKGQPKRKGEQGRG